MHGRPVALWQGIRPVDVVITGLIAGLGVALMVLNIGTDGVETRVDSHSWWLIPVWLLTTLPLLWWRRSPTLALSTSVVAMAAHVLIFGHLVRCGAGLPLAFVAAFLAGYGSERRRGLLGLGLTAVLSTLVLIRDTVAGPEVLPVVFILQGVLWGIGRVARSRSAMADQLRARTDELRALRDERSALEVADDRARVSDELQGLLDARLQRLEALATQGAAASDEGADSAASGAASQALLLTLEEDSRRTLEDMRRIVGVLRGGEVALAPTPSVAHLEGLLARYGTATLTVEGDPRVLPPSLELSAYRIVEHLLGALGQADGATGAAPQVALHFADDALEIRMSGSAPRGSELRAAVARAKERALLHAGRLEVQNSRGKARVVARLPVLNG